MNRNENNNEMKLKQIYVLHFKLQLQWSIMFSVFVIIFKYILKSPV